MKDHDSYTKVFETAKGKSFGVRPISPADKKALQESLHQVSPESLRFRFFEYKKDFSPKELEYLTNVDGKKHCALVAVDLNSGEEALGVGVARYVTDPQDPSTAEVGLIIRDNYHSQGIGSKLFDALIEHAKSCGLKSLTGSINIYNEKMLKLVRHIPSHEFKRIDEGTYKLTIPLDDSSRGSV